MVILITGWQFKIRINGCEPIFTESKYHQSYDLECDWFGTEFLAMPSKILARHHLSHLLVANQLPTLI